MPGCLYTLAIVVATLQVSTRSIALSTTSSTYRFTGRNGSQILTSDENLTSEGHVLLVTSGSRAVLELLAGGSVLLPSFPCLAHLDSCVTGFTLSLTLKMPVVLAGRVHILDSGLATEKVGGLWLYQQDNTLTCVLSGPSQLWRVDAGQSLAPDRWHQLHVSWHPALGLSLWGGPHVLGSRVYPYPRAVRAVRSGQLRLGSPGNVGSGSLLVSAVTVTPRVITEILRAGLSSQNLGTTTERSPTTTKMPSAEPNKGVSIRFLAITTQRNLVTTVGEMTVHGHVTLELMQMGLVLVMATRGAIVDMGTPLTCLDNVTSCLSGFNLRVTFQFLEISTGPNFLLYSGANMTDANGLTLYYYSGHLVFHVIANKTLWRGSFRYSFSPGVWYSVDASWDRHNVTVHVNNVAVKGLVSTTLHASSTPRPDSSRSLHLGGVPGYNGTTVMKVHSLDLWTMSRSKLNPEELRLPQFQNETLATPGFTEDAHSPCNITTQPTDFYWPFTNAQNSTVTSNCVLANFQSVDRSRVSSSGVRLSSPGQHVHVDLKRWTELRCLSAPVTCSSGVTVGLSLTLHALEEGAVLFGSGGEAEGVQGLALLYRYGEFRAIVNTEHTEWYASFPPALLPLGQLTQVHVGWNGQDEVHVYINSSLVGFANASDGQTHGRSLPVGWNALYVGSFDPALGFEPRALDCTVSWLRLWLRGPGTLVDDGVLQNTETDDANTRNPGPADAGSSESLRGGGSAVDGEDVAVVVLGVLCAVLAVVAVVGAIIFWKLRRSAPKKTLSATVRTDGGGQEPHHSTTAVSPAAEDYFFKSTPLAFNNHSFVDNEAMLY